MNTLRFTDNSFEKPLVSITKYSAPIKHWFTLLLACFLLLNTAKAETAPTANFLLSSKQAFAGQHLSFYNTKWTVPFVCTEPTVYTVASDWYYCRGTAGAEIRLNNSEIGVSYQLKKDNITPVDLPVVGTGSPLSFGRHTAEGGYTVEGTRIIGGCKATMYNFVFVYEATLPNIYYPLSTTNLCTTTAYNFTLENIGGTPRPDYSPNGNTYNISPTLPTGMSFDNTTGIISGQPTITTPHTIYTVTTQNVCGTDDTQIAFSTEFPPTIYTVTGGGTICAGGSPLTIGLSDSEIGSSYQLQRNGSDIGLPTIGTGNALDFGNQTADGVYTVTARKYGGACLTSMSGSKTITNQSNVTPSVYIQANPLVLGICAGAPLTLTAVPQNGGTPTYQWRKNGIDISGERAVTFTSSTLADGDIITVEMTSNACTTTPTAVSPPTRITIKPAPTINTVGNQTVTAGSNTTPITFTGTGATSYTWTNDNTATGLAASGVGDIAAFTTTNNTATAITSTVRVTPVSGVLSPANAYVTNTSSNTVSVINTSTNAVVNTIAVGSGPQGVSVSPDGSRVYIANFSSNTVSVINTSTNTVVATIGVGSSPTGVVVSPDGSRVYAANRYSDNVSVINTSTNTVVATVGVAANPGGVSVSPDGSRLYVTNRGSNSVSVINTSTNTIVATIGVGAYPLGISMSPDGSRLYITSRDANSVSVINTSTNTVVATVAVGTQPVCLSVSPDGRLVYATHYGSNTLSVINTSTNTVVATIVVGDAPSGVSFSSDGSRAYIANFNSNTVSVINTNTNTVVATVAVGSSPIAFGNFIKAEIPECTGTPTTFTLTVNARPPSVSIAITAGSQTICAGSSVTFTATPINGGTPTYVWRKNGNPISGQTSETYTTTDLANNDVITCVMTSSLTGFSTTTATSAGISMTVNPAPTVSSISNQTVCDGDNTTGITFTGTLATRFDWTNNIPSIGLSGAGSGNINAFTANNTSLNPVQASITVTPVYINSGFTCNGTPTNFSITVNPRPSPITVSAATSPFCAGAPVALSYTGGTTTAVFSENFNAPLINWTSINNSSGGSVASAAWTLRPSGYSYRETFVTPDASSFYMSNSDAQGSGTTTNTITTTQAFSTIGFTNMTLALSHYYSAYSGQTGKVQLSKDGISWTDIETYLSSRGTSSSFAMDNIVVPTAFENQASVYLRFQFNSFYGWYWAINEVTITGASAVTPNLAWSSTPAGFTSTLLNPTDRPTVNTNYKVLVTNTLGCSRSGTLDVPVTPNVTPSVSIVSNRTGAICAGTSVTLTATPQNGGAPTYQWRKGGIDINGERSSSYTSASLNDGDVISVVMTSNAACVSTPTATSSPITIVVKPIPTVNTITNQTVCDGLNTTPIAFTGAFAGTRFDWINSLPSIGLNGSGNGNISTFVGTNTTLTPVNARISVTPSLTNSGLTCTGTPSTFSIIVNPRPTPVTVASAQNNVCSGSPVALSYSGGTNSNIVFSENFNTTLTNWTSINNSTGGSVASAAWTLLPNGYSYREIFLTPDASGFYMSNSDAQGSGTTTNTITTTQAFSTVGFTNMKLALSHYYLGWGGQTGKVQLSKDGITWMDIQTFIESRGASSSFLTENIVVPTAFENQASVYLRFQFNSFYGWYWAINDVSISGTGANLQSITWSTIPAGFTSNLPNPTANPTVNTNYKVVLTNSLGCSRDGAVNVTVKSLPTFTASPTNILCNGGPKGKIDIIANTGTAPFYFSNDDGATYSAATTSPYTFTNLSKGTYKIKIKDANGCESIAQDVVITEPTPLSINGRPNVIFCAGSETTINVTASGGTTTAAKPYQYSLNGGAFQASSSFTVRAGAYAITVKDANDCTASTAPLTISEGVPLIQCPQPIRIECSQLNDDRKALPSLTGQLSVTGACLTAQQITYTDVEYNMDCGRLVSSSDGSTTLPFNPNFAVDAKKVLLRRFAVNSASVVSYACYQAIFIVPNKLSDIVFPPNITLTCANSRTEPNDTVINHYRVAGAGEPTLNSLTYNRTFCDKFTTTFTDVRTTTTTGLTIQRTWVIKADCGSNSRTQVQTITVPNCTVSNISGAISRENGTEIPATTQLSNLGTGTNITETGVNFAFRNLPLNSRLQLRPTRPNTDWTNGVTMLDVSFLSKHLLDIAPISSPYNLISADANADGSLDATDMLLMQRLILRLIPALPNNNSWRFIYKKFLFPNPDNPFSADFPELLVIPALTQAISNADFVAIKVGDINQSAGSVNIRGGATPFKLLVEDVVLEKGKTYQIPIEMTPSVSALQFTLNVDKNVAKIEGISKGNLPNFTDNNVGLFQKEGVITAAWHRKNGQFLNETDKLTMMQLTLKPTENTRLSDILSVNSLYTEGVAYDGKGTGLPVELAFSNQKSISDKAVLLPNRPNPFSDETTISFTLPEAGKAKLMVYDLLGKIVMTTEKTFAKGLNEVVFDATSTPSVSNGIFVVRLQTTTGVLEQKIVLSR
jgi:YVTN family beta-propeller protein